MKIQLLSDLHLESNPDFMPSPAPGADVLVLAGDIGSYQAGSALANAGDGDFGLARFSPLHGWPTPVLFVPGNHEYDGLDFDEAHTRLRQTCERLGITWLEREVLQLGGVRFVGTTLWTDFDALGPLAGQPIPDPLTDKIPAHFSHPNSQFTRQLKARDKAFRAANYYLRKTLTTRQSEPWLAEGLREMGVAQMAMLRGRDVPPGLLTLPMEFAGIKPALRTFIATLFEDNPYQFKPVFRGFYFTSALQEGVAVQPASDRVARQFALGPGQGHGEPVATVLQPGRSLGQGAKQGVAFDFQGLVGLFELGDARFGGLDHALELDDFVGRVGQGLGAQQAHHLFAHSGVDGRVGELQVARGGLPGQGDLADGLGLFRRRRIGGLGGDFGRTRQAGVGGLLDRQVQAFAKLALLEVAGELSQLDAAVDKQGAQILHGGHSMPARGRAGVNATAGSAAGCSGSRG